MFRMFAIAVIIFGLIAQPLMAAMPDSMPNGETSSSLSMHSPNLHIDTSDQDITVSDQASQTPCHQVTDDQTAPISCANCDNGCTNGACASACSMGAIAVLIPSLLTFERTSAGRVIAASIALVHRAPSRIFHPPKHA